MQSDGGSKIVVELPVATFVNVFLFDNREVDTDVDGNEEVGEDDGVDDKGL